jgi:hypothetical protein
MRRIISSLDKQWYEVAENAGGASNHVLSSNVVIGSHLCMSIAVNEMRIRQMLSTFVMTVRL